MAKSAKRTIGDKGEDVACQYLEARGFTVIARNYLRPWGEIDIVAEKPDLLVFVEVKSVSRESSALVSRETGGQGIRPEENMNAFKLKKLSRVIQTYLISKKVPESRVWRIDLACVYLDLNTGKGKVEMFENIN